MSLLSKSVEKFTFDSLAHLGQNLSDGIVYSPYSVFAALSLVACISNQETRSEIFKAIGYKEDATAEEFASDVSKLLSSVEIGAGNNYNIVGANSIWPNEAIEFGADDFKILVDILKATVTPVKFPQPGVDTINAKVAEITNNLITNLLKPADCPATTSLVLTNAIYFKAKWQKKFDKAGPNDFTKLDGSVYQTPLMKKIDEFRYFENDEYQMVEIPYLGIQFSMVCVLPKTTSKEALDALCCPVKLNEGISNLKQDGCVVVLPKFKIESSFAGLTETLNQMGIKRIFSSGSGLPANSSVSKIIQKAIIIVDEDGTEAAAATAIMMMRCMPRMPAINHEFIANHPFVYLLRNTQTGAIVFMGACTEPHPKE